MAVFFVPWKVEAVFCMPVERLGSIVATGSTPFRMLLVDVMIFSVDSSALWSSLFVSGFDLATDRLLTICNLSTVLCPQFTW